MKLSRQNQPLVWLAFTSAVLAGLIDFGHSHTDNADSLIPVLVSLQRWTPFFWAQDRFGMVIALLAIPIRNPLSNLLFQNALTTFCGLYMFVLAARYFFPTRAWPVVAVASQMFHLGLASEQMRFETFSTVCPYNSSVTFGLAGLLLLEKGRRRWGWLLLLLGSWVNMALPLVLLPLLAARVLWPAPNAPTASEPRIAKPSLFTRVKSWWGPEWPTVQVVIGAAFVSFVVSRFETWTTVLLPAWPWLWPWGWYKMAAGQWTSTPGAWFLGLGVAAIVGLTARLLFRGRAVVEDIQRSALRVVAAYAILWVVLGALGATAANEYSSRYLVPGFPLLITALLGLAILPWFEQTGRALWLSPAVSMTLFVAALAVTVAVYGPPSMRQVRADIAKLERSGSAPAIVASGADFVAGDYWTVWTTVFRANVELYESGDLRVIRGITHRANAALDARPRAAHPKIAIIGEKGWYWLEEFGFAKGRDEVTVLDQYGDFTLISGT